MSAARDGLADESRRWMDGRMDGKGTYESATPGGAQPTFACPWHGLALKRNRMGIWGITRTDRGWKRRTERSKGGVKSEGEKGIGSSAGCDRDFVVAKSREDPWAEKKNWDFSISSVERPIRPTIRRRNANCGAGGVGQGLRHV